MSVLIEAVFVAIIVIIVGFALHLTAMRFGSHDLNDASVYAGHLAAIGFATHLLCEGMGLNKWYCKNGSACN
jgi:hypothetical protein